jgi:hypothetical protein
MEVLKRNLPPTPVRRDDRFRFSLLRTPYSGSLPRRIVPEGTCVGKFGTVQAIVDSEAD